MSRSAGRLLLFDLGYFKWQLFTRIQARGHIAYSGPFHTDEAKQHLALRG